MNKYTVEEVREELRDLYQKKSLVPFIGAGFSIPLSLPSWDNLLGNLGEQLGYDRDIFLKLGSLQQLAEYVYREDTKEWKKFLLNISTEFNSHESDEKRRTSIQHQALSKLDFPVVYTTNYDMHIEKTLEESGKNVNAISVYEDFIRARKNNFECEVLKFHGSLEEQDSIVLSESQYFNRMNLEGALDQRLRADALSKSFLFMGYSFSDPNIRYIFYKLHKLRANVSSTNNRVEFSYITAFGMNDIQAKLLKQWNIKVIELDPSNKEKSISELLDSLK
uniref:SIR2 family protein n=1 Tax=uncultured Dysgonomonas sp. TaxID=206096 RepID=UPI00263058F2|nr:SIR2 family protein [uncultured Dysgonomonas sp.]